MQFIEQLDIRLFFFINGHNSPFFDVLFYYISLPYTWIPCYVLLLIIFYKKYPFRDLLFILLSFALLIFLSDKGSVLIFKNTVARYRPCHNLEFGHLVHLYENKCGGQFGFISSHAANFFALATLITLLLKQHYKNIAPVVFSAAIVVAYSRVYLGVHYPLDVIAGALYGVCVATIIFVFIKKLILVQKTT